VEEAKIDRTVSDLVADYDRKDGYLTEDHVERLLEKRKLSVEECSEVYRQLNSLGITIESESEIFDNELIHHVDSIESVNPDSETAHGRIHWLPGLDIKLLTPNEEVELGRKMELGRRAQEELENGVERSEEHDRIIERALRAKNEMIKANLRLVLYIAKPYVGMSDLDLDDLFQEGVVGLMRAVNKYDHTLGYKFSTYATWWIRQTITRSLADRGRTIRLPVYVYSDVIQFKRAYKLLTQIHLDRRISMAELADELTWAIDKVHFIQQVSALVPLSLDEQLDEYDDFSLIATLVSDLPSPEEQLNQTELTKCIEHALTTLTKRESTVLSLRFGLFNSRDKLTLEEIGQAYGLTRERIRQIEVLAIRRLRHPSNAEKLRDFLDS
jgi:RNA polymerase primary sigma factor